MTEPTSVKTDQGYSLLLQVQMVVLSLGELGGLLGEFPPHSQDHFQSAALNTVRVKYQLLRYCHWASNPPSYTPVCGIGAGTPQTLFFLSQLLDFLIGALGVGTLQAVCWVLLPWHCPSLSLPRWLQFPVSFQTPKPQSHHAPDGCHHQLPLPHPPPTMGWEN